jgi:hypothetical protein
VPRLEAIKKYLYKRNEIIFAYLYGSYANNSNNKLSDIDIAVYIDNKQKPVSSYFGYKSELITELQSMTSKDIDLIILNEVPDKIAYNALNEGSLMFTKSNNISNRFYNNIINNTANNLSDYNIIKDKLKILYQYIMKLKQYEEITPKKLTNNLELLWSTERGIQLIGQTVIDIGKFILRKEKLTEEHNKNIMKKLSEHKIISKSLARRMTKLEIYKLANQNLQLDEEKIVEVINTRLEDFEKFYYNIRSHINKIQP